MFVLTELMGLPPTHCGMKDSGGGALTLVRPLFGLNYASGHEEIIGILENKVLWRSSAGGWGRGGRPIYDTASLRITCAVFYSG